MDIHTFYTFTKCFPLSDVNTLAVLVLMKSMNILHDTIIDGGVVSSLMLPDESIYMICNLHIGLSDIRQCEAIAFGSFLTDILSYYVVFVLCTNPPGFSILIP